MAGFDFSFLSNALDDTKGSGISFESQAKKWETEDQGMPLLTTSILLTVLSLGHPVDCILI